MRECSDGIPKRASRQADELRGIEGKKLYGRELLSQALPVMRPVYRLVCKALHTPAQRASGNRARYSVERDRIRGSTVVAVAIWPNLMPLIDHWWE